MLWLASLLAAPLLGAAGKPLGVSLNAPWHSSTEELIVLETLQKYNASSYFPLLSHILNVKFGEGETVDEDSSTQLAERDLYDFAVQKNFLKPAQVGLAQQEVALGRVLPLLESQYGLFEDIVAENKDLDCPVVAWIEDKYTCDISDLYALQAPKTPAVPLLFPTDHVIGVGDQWIVVYADIDSETFPDWHTVLMEMAMTSKITYVLRARPSTTRVKSGVEKRVNLGGYGVGVHLKKTDYFVVDDRDFDKDVKIDSKSLDKVPQSKVPYLGIEAAKRVRNAGSAAEQFSLLKDLSYNMPEHALDLAKSISGEADLETEREANKIGGLGLNGVFINGEASKARDPNEFFSSIHQQLSIINTLEAYLPEKIDISSLLTTGIALDDFDDARGEMTRPKQRYNLRAAGDAIGWINDVETDALYQPLGSDLNVLLESPGPFVPIRSNMHSVVVAGDLADQRVQFLLKSLLQQAGQQLPLQVGIVSSNAVWQRIAKYGVETRQTFIIQLLLGATFEEAERNAYEAYAEANSPVKTPLADPAEWLQRFGVEGALAKEPVVFVNGIPLTVETWRDMAIPIFEKDFKFLQDSFSTLDKNTSLRDVLFSTGVTERNKLLDPLDESVYTPWPLTSPIQAFRNPDIKANEKHSVLFSSNFQTPESFDIVLNLLNRSFEQKDIEVYVRPLQGIDESFYKAILNPGYNMFRFSKDLFGSVKAHFFDNKTAPKILTAEIEPATPASDLPADTDSLIIDGRYVEIEGEAVDAALLDSLIDRETNRLQRILRAAPGIDGIGVAALTSVAQARTMIGEDTVPDISIQSDRNASSVLRVVVVTDPGSGDGQYLIALADLAIKAGLHVDIFLSPSELKAMPSRFFRPVFDRHVGANFTNLADDVLYTAELLEPAAWMTRTLSTDYDLDNIILNTVKENWLNVTYELRSLLVQGFARGSTAPGTVLSLRASDGTKVCDTTVMANLGYFQLRAPQPGLYQVCTSDNNVALRSSAGILDCVDALVASHAGTSLQIEIIPARPEQRVLRNRQDNPSVWGKLRSAIGHKDGTDNKPAADINIFTVASGHLYERFASIMMLSVMRHSKHSVKFWLIENFLSPKFREFLPELAKEYGFDYEFVNYKWPSWLRGQTEKQRQIWGYKMLFLDVLFPQSLHDVIFVDSDQIARTDFKELLDIDLEGAPYAFTPMGEDREESEPYRFWKQGFWKKALIDNGLKYHISALYRVDLDAFRQTKTGDIIRQQYQRLSSNPENLANLDQDLPNSLQPVVPIYSLPQEWLWCETWCHNAGLPWAKTIDLCNNPLTKEPKLDRAKRLIPEWTEYDDEVAKLTESWELKRAAEASSKQSSSKAAASTKSQSSSRSSAAAEAVETGGSSLGWLDDEDIIHDEL